MCGWMKSCLTQILKSKAILLWVDILKSSACFSVKHVCALLVHLIFSWTSGLISSKSSHVSVTVSPASKHCFPPGWECVGGASIPEKEFHQQVESLSHSKEVEAWPKQVFLKVSYHAHLPGEGWAVGDLPPPLHPPRYLHSSANILVLEFILWHRCSFTGQDRPLFFVLESPPVQKSFQLSVWMEAGEKAVRLD